MLHETATDLALAGADRLRRQLDVFADLLPDALETLPAPTAASIIYLMTLSSVPVLPVETGPVQPTNSSSPATTLPGARQESNPSLLTNSPNHAAAPASRAASCGARPSAPGRSSSRRRTGPRGGGLRSWSTRVMELPSAALHASSSEIGAPLARRRRSPWRRPKWGRSSLIAQTQSGPAAPGASSNAQGRPSVLASLAWRLANSSWLSSAPGGPARSASASSQLPADAICEGPGGSSCPDCCRGRSPSAPSAAAFGLASGPSCPGCSTASSRSVSQAALGSAASVMPNGCLRDVLTIWSVNCPEDSSAVFGTGPVVSRASRMGKALARTLDSGGWMQ
mmetsp:Transcript_71774/g.187112  ORF Transcript_71774/g.187112 Transcript_71774/m.187112 type:complete len:338 (+) Transcript_71774:89-1102(+)